MEFLARIFFPEDEEIKNNDLDYLRLFLCLVARFKFSQAKSYTRRKTKRWTVEKSSRCRDEDQGKRVQQVVSNP
jgi:hypothetical protein